jgi:hypothetical protein
MLEELLLEARQMELESNGRAIAHRLELARLAKLARVGRPPGWTAFRQALAARMSYTG